MRVALTTPPAEEPVTLAEALHALRVEHDTDDARVEGLIKAARQTTERVAGRSLITRTYTATFEAREMRGGFVLPYGPVATVTSFNTYDASGTATLVTTDDYQLAGDFIGAHPGGGLWVPERPRDAGVVVYTAGYGDVADVPQPLKEYVLAVVRALYHGETVTPVERALLEPFVDYQYG